MHANDASRIIIIDFRKMVQIVASLADIFRSIIHDNNMLIVEATVKFQPALNYLTKQIILFSRKHSSLMTEKKVL
jgi:hypothetical protein